MKKITLSPKSVLPFILLLFSCLIPSLGISQTLQVSGNNTVIANGSTIPSTTDFTDFGSVPNGNKFSRSFVLKNTGTTSNLVFPASAVSISGTNANQFKITTNVVLGNSIYSKYTANNLSPNFYTVIEISFEPTSIGLKTATLTINLTTGSPKPYTFTIQGTGTTAATADFTMTQLNPNLTFNYPYELFYGPDNYLWLTERVGKRVVRVNPTTSAVDVLVQIPDVYQTGGQDGLMGMVLDPDFGKSLGKDYVYVAYTYSITGDLGPGTNNDASRRTKIVRYNYTGGGTDGTMSNPYILIEGLSGSNDHNSGRLAVGPDKKIYYSIGDQGVNQFENRFKVSHAQDIPSQDQINNKDYSFYEGKVLRLDLDGKIPTDNPTIKGVKSHIFTYGHRNVQGLVFGKNGKLYAGEHGPKSDDEINLLQSGGNYGWPFISGYKDDKNYAYCNWSTVPNYSSAAFSDDDFPTGAVIAKESDWTVAFTPPITTLFTIPDGFNSTGGWLTWPTVGPSSAGIYEGFASEIPGWDNTILLTTLKKGRVYRQKLSSDGNSVVGAPEEFFYTQNRYRDLAIDPDGKSFYIITDSGGTTSGPSGSNSLSPLNPGTILKFTYSPNNMVSCAAPVPTVASLPTITDTCSVTLTAPTATNNCSGTITGITTTTFPITTPGTTVVTWTYNYGNGLTLTQNQSVTITTNGPLVVPTFTPISLTCTGTTLTALPTTSINGITGTWSPALNNTTTTTYTFTPATGQCAATTTMTITIGAKVTPLFNQIDTICSGVLVSPLPTTSLNGITGTWSPAFDNTITKSYTFTPTTGQCSLPANTASLTINVNTDASPITTSATNTYGQQFTANWIPTCAPVASYKLDVFTLGAQTSIAEWKFNNGTSGIATLGTGASAITTNTGATAVFNATGNPNYSASSTKWDSGSGSKYWQVDFSTTGKYNLKVSSAQNSNSTGPKEFKLQYKIGSAGTWTDVSSSATITLANDFTSGVFINASLPTICENQTSVYLRWIMTSNTSVGNGTVAAGGTSQIDNIVISSAANTPVSGYTDLDVGNVTSKVITGLTNTTNYGYVVRSVVSSVSSANSNTILVTTNTNSPITNTVSQTNVSCFNGSNGSATIIGATGGNGTFTYLWSPSGGTSSTASNLVAGNYTCTITDVINNNSKRVDFIITQPLSNTIAIPTLADITGQCAASPVVPTTTDSCSRIITGTTTTPFPITAAGTTVVTWKFTDANGNFITANQNVIINSTTYTTASGWSNGSPTSGKGAIISGNLTISTNLTACSLTVNNNAIVLVKSGFNLDIYGDITVSTGSSLTFENNSNLVQTKNTNGNSGNINVKRDSSPLFRLDYSMWSSPVTGSQTMTDFSPLTTTGRFYDYTTSTDKYSIVANTSTFGLAKGYLIRMPNTWIDYGMGSAASWTGTFTGVPNNGTITYPISLAGTGFNAVGNPYPSTLNIDNFINGNIGNINGTLYFWRKRNDATNLTSYSTCTTAGCTLNNSHTYPNTDYISIGQGFIVKALSTTLNFNNTMRLANNQNQFFKTKAVEKNRIWLNLLNDTTPVNQMLVAYMSGATMEIDPTIDGAYFNDSQTALNSLIGSEEFAVQGRALPFDPTDEVALSFKALNAGNYSIAIDHVDGLFSGNQDIILKDNTNGTETDLKSGSYSFTAAAGNTNTRFSLKYQKTLGINNPIFDENSVVVFKSNGKIQIKSNGTSIDNVKVYDIRGRLLVEKNKVNATETSIESSKFANQVLIVQIKSNDNKIVKKKVVN